MPRAVLAAALCSAVVLLGLTDSGNARHSSERPASVVNFLASCSVSRYAPDDPIVYPGQPGRSHDHTFFGSKAIAADAMLEELRAAETTCGRKAETAAYWVPTLFRDGRRIQPLRATAYYTLRQFSGVRPYPPGLEIIAGDPTARLPQPLDIVWWSCGPFSSVRRSSAAPSRCPASSDGLGARVVGRPRARNRRPSLELHVRFPDCWDGRRVDSADHRAHMAYQSGGQCPRSHPVRVPSLILIVVYPIRDGRGVSLSSGGQLSGHADFVNAWDQQELARIVRDCSQARPRCARR